MRKLIMLFALGALAQGGCGCAASRPAVSGEPFRLSWSDGSRHQRLWVCEDQGDGSADCVSYEGLMRFTMQQALQGLECRMKQRPQALTPDQFPQ